LTIKSVLAKIGKKFNVVIEALLDVAVTRMQDRDAKALEAEIRFPTTTLSPTLQLLRQKLTGGSFNLVLGQSEKPTTSYSYTAVYI
jgi:hypothetical protein